MKIKGVTFLDSGCYRDIKIIDNINSSSDASIIIDGEKSINLMKTSSSFSEGIRGKSNNDIKEVVINKFLKDNKINFIGNTINAYNSRYINEIRSTCEKKLLFGFFPSEKCRNEILIKYLSDRYEFLLDNLNDSDEINLVLSDISCYQDCGNLNFALASRYNKLYPIEKDLIIYLMDLLYDNKEISIKTNYEPGIYINHVNSFDIVGLKKNLNISNMFANRYYLNSNNDIMNILKVLIEEYNNNYKNIVKLQMKMEGF